MITEFPLFRLPYLPFAQIINHLRLYELIKISLISKKSYELSKFARRKLPSDQIQLVFGRKIVGAWSSRDEYLIMVMEESELKKDDCIEGSVRINGALVPTLRRPYYPLMTIWKNKLDGLISVMEYVLKFFELNIESAFIATNRKYPKCLSTITDFISTLQQPIVRCQLEGDVTNDAELTYFFEKKPVKSLHLDGKASRQFAYNGVFDWDNINIVHGSWVTLSNIIGNNFQNLYVNHSKLTSYDVNTLLKRWLSSVSTKLETIKILMPPIELDEVLEGLEAEEIEPGRQFTVKRHDDTTGTIEYFRFLDRPTDLVYFYVDMYGASS